MQIRLCAANQKQSIALENIDFNNTPGLGRSLISKLAGCKWMASYLNVLITELQESARVGWLACGHIAL